MWAQARNMNLTVLCLNLVTLLVHELHSYVTMTCGFSYRCTVAFGENSICKFIGLSVSSVSQPNAWLLSPFHNLVNANLFEWSSLLAFGHLSLTPGWDNELSRVRIPFMFTSLSLRVYVPQPFFDLQVDVDERWHMF